MCSVQWMCGLAIQFIIAIIAGCCALAASCATQAEHESIRSHKSFTFRAHDGRRVPTHSTQYMRMSSCGFSKIFFTSPLLVAEHVITSIPFERSVHRARLQSMNRVNSYGYRDLHRLALAAASPPMNGKGMQRSSRKLRST